MGKLKNENVMQGVHDWLDLDELPLLASTEFLAQSVGWAK
jgi:hypothetical protein